MDKISDIKLELIGELQKQNKYVRELNIILNIPKSTISDKLKELYKQNIIDFKIDGRNKQYFIKNTIEGRTYLKFYEIYKFSKLIEKYSNLKLILDELTNKSNNELIILFGSYSKFKAGEKSDIDIYIETTNKKLKEEINLINSKINVKIGKFDKESNLGKEILLNHIIIQNIDKYYKLIEK